MSRIILIIVGLALAAGMLVAPVLAKDGGPADNGDGRSPIDRLKDKADKLRGQIEGRLGGAGAELRMSRTDGREGRAAVGAISALSESSITVDEHTFALVDDTKKPDDLAVGDLVQVRGELKDGKLVAREIRRINADIRRMKAFRLTGEVQALSETSITVNGETAGITESTRAPEDLAVGDTVTVAGVINPEGERTARTIVRDEDERSTRFEVKDGKFVARGEVQSIATGNGLVDIGLNDKTVRIAPLEVEAYSQRGTPTRGAFVQIHGIARSDGTFLATSVRVQS